MGRFACCAATLLLLSMGTAEATSTQTRITPENQGRMPFAVSISAERFAEDHSVRFTVTLEPKDEPLCESRTGELTVWEEEAAARSPLNQLGSRIHRSAIMVTCSVSEKKAHMGICYFFTLHEDLVRRASFAFVCWARGMPAFDAYEVLPADFMKPNK